MPKRVPFWAGSNSRLGPEPFTWFSMVVRLVGVPAMALLWSALAYLPWQRAGSASLSQSWPPSMPILYTGLAVAIFGSVGASLVVVTLIRPGRLASLSIALGFLISVAVTLSRGAGTYDKILNSAERQTMLGVSAFGALVGIAIGAIAIGSPSRLGFLGLLAVFPVASLVAVVLGIGGDHRWLTRGALLVLLVLIGWSRWFGILFWPVFFALFWLLTLVVAAVESGAQTLRHPWDGYVSVRTVTDAMLDFAGSAWRELLGSSWELFWPAAAFAALVVAGVHAWRRTGASPA